MTKRELGCKTETAVKAVRTALQTVYGALNSGQQQKLLRDETVAALFARYGVETQ